MCSLRVTLSRINMCAVSPYTRGKTNPSPHLLQLSVRVSGRQGVWVLAARLREVWLEIFPSVGAVFSVPSNFPCTEETIYTPTLYKIIINVFQLSERDATFTLLKSRGVTGHTPQGQHFLLGGSWIWAWGLALAIMFSRHEVWLSSRYNLLTRTISK